MTVRKLKGKKPIREELRFLLPFLKSVDRESVSEESFDIPIIISQQSTSTMPTNSQNSDVVEEATVTLKDDNGSDIIIPVRNLL